MKNEQLATINGTSFVVCLGSIVCGVIVGLLGIWGVISTSDGSLWRALGTCGVVFAGAVCASLAIRCFRTNE